MRKAALLHIRDRENLQIFKRADEEEAGVEGTVHGEYRNLV